MRLNMKSIYQVLFLMSCIILTSCKNSSQQQYGNNDVLESNIFTNIEIGWTMTIPSNWKVASKEESNKRVLEGYESIESTTSEEYDKSQFTNILTFEKDMFNTFSSTIEKYDLELHGDWKITNSVVKKMAYETYIKQGLKVDSTHTKTESIDGIEFEFYEFSFYNQNKEIVLNQIMYSKLINGFDFGVNINYNNLDDKNLLLNNWRDSKFSFKN